jgi:hypothetical protein
VGTLVRDCRWHCGAKPHLQSRNSDTNVRALGTNSGAPTAPVVKQAVTSCFHVEGLRREPCQHSGPVYGKARLTITAVHHLATTRGLRLPSECLLPRFPPHLGAQKPVRKPRLTYRLIPVVVLMPVLGVVSSLGNRSIYHPSSSRPRPNARPLIPKKPFVLPNLALGAARATADARRSGCASRAQTRAPPLHGHSPWPAAVADGAAL